MADRHIAAGQARVDEQERRILELVEHGHETAVAEKFLHQLVEHLVQWQRHRERIAEKTAIIRSKGQIPSP